MIHLPPPAFHVLSFSPLKIAQYPFLASPQEDLPPPRSQKCQQLGFFFFLPGPRNEAPSPIISVRWSDQIMEYDREFLTPPTKFFQGALSSGSLLCFHRRSDSTSPYHHVPAHTPSHKLPRDLVLKPQFPSPPAASSQ